MSVMLVPREKTILDMRQKLAGIFSFCSSNPKASRGEWLEVNLEEQVGFKTTLELSPVPFVWERLPPSSQMWCCVMQVPCLSGRQVSLQQSGRTSGGVSLAGCVRRRVKWRQAFCPERGPWSACGRLQHLRERRGDREGQEPQASPMDR